MKAIILFSLLFGANVTLASTDPCAGVQRTKSAALQQYVPTVSKQIKKQLPSAKRVSIIESFKFDDWQILEVQTDVNDNAYLFYSKSPLLQSYVTLWAGFATEDEGPEIRKWVDANAKGIPDSLAKCFVWHVTRENAE